MAALALPDLQLPNLVMTPADVSRLLREIEALDEYLRQSSLRVAGQPTEKLPKTSRMLDEVATSNALNLLDADARTRMAAFLKELASHAPVVHISFAVDPSSAFLQKLVVWFRQNSGAPVLVRVGLQPAIAAGCAIRTPNKYFDFSLRQHLVKQRHYLRDALVVTRHDTVPPLPTGAVPVSGANP